MRPQPITPGPFAAEMLIAMKAAQDKQKHGRWTGFVDAVKTGWLEHGIGGVFESALQPKFGVYAKNRILRDVSRRMVGVALAKDAATHPSVQRQIESLGKQGYTHITVDKHGRPVAKKLSKFFVVDNRAKLTSRQRVVSRAQYISIKDLQSVAKPIFVQAIGTSSKGTNMSAVFRRWGENFILGETIRGKMVERKIPFDCGLTATFAPTISPAGKHILTLNIPANPPLVQNPETIVLRISPKLDARGAIDANKDQELQQQLDAMTRVFGNNGM